MAKIGISICPLMTRDPENPVFCRKDCAVFCEHSCPSEEHDGYCGMMPE
ncbi:hypothetical protein M0R72_18390 [Candidatus Pacearchaeota archaeon]|jgi:hypothetical protein|nr:hypothetical protein [Candidatus Pacearchaeota archaeon]